MATGAAALTPDLTKRSQFFPDTSCLERPLPNRRYDCDDTNGRLHRLFRTQLLAERTVVAQLGAKLLATPRWTFVRSAVRCASYAVSLIARPVLPPFSSMNSMPAASQCHPDFVRRFSSFLQGAPSSSFQSCLMVGSETSARVG